MNRSEQFWTLLHELAQIVDASATHHHCATAFTSDLELLPRDLKQNAQRDLHVVNAALTQLTEELILRPSLDQRVRRSDEPPPGSSMPQ
jgi:hypothetical protein